MREREPLRVHVFVAGDAATAAAIRWAAVTTLLAAISLLAALSAAR
jgi:hypothetical protein